MGIVSSMLLDLIINICWQCRLFLEGNHGRDEGQQLRSPLAGFLNTPEATSTPLTPDKSATKSPDLDASSRAPQMRKRKSSRQGKKKHADITELLSPIEEDLILKLAKSGCTLRIGITPSMPKRDIIVNRIDPMIVNRELPSLLPRPSITCMALDLAKPQLDFRTRGIRL